MHMLREGKGDAELFTRVFLEKCNNFARIHNQEVILGTRGIIKVFGSCSFFFSFLNHILLFLISPS